MTSPVLRTESVTAAVAGLAARCDGPTLATLTAALGGAVYARPETLPGGPHTADTIATACARLAGVIGRHPTMIDADVAAYAVILPVESVAFAADRTGFTHYIQLPGVHTEPLYSDRWNYLIESITAMIDAANR
jgi:hypothetical protein